MPDHLPTDWSTLCALVFLLGMRHGLDADHLAAIDGLTRVSARHGRAHARWCGALFSAGHGAVVLAIAALAGMAGAQWVPPAWFDALGSAVSIVFLAWLGAANLLAVHRAAPAQAVPLVGLRGRWVRRLLAMLPGRLGEARGALAVAGVGALFALSFDTLSQAALFAVMAVQYGGLAQALWLGGLFVLGMLVSDGANGWWISHLITRTDERAALASRTMTLAVGCISLGVAALGAARWLSVRVAGWTDGRELAIGGGVMVLMALAYGLACRLAPAPVAGRQP